MISIIRRLIQEVYLLQLIAPLFLALAFFFSGKTPLLSYDLIVLSFFGLFLSFKKGMKGSIYALLLLGLSAALKHSLMDGHHGRLLALEISVGLSLFISSLAFAERTSTMEALQQERGAKEQTIHYLEEELIQKKEEFAAQQMTVADKLSALSQSLEEVQGELSSFKMLNEVLRKASAKEGKEKEALSHRLIEKERHIGRLLAEEHELQKELCRIKEEDALFEQNRLLLKQLNQARMSEEQMRLLYEPLEGQIASLQKARDELILQLDAAKKEPTKISEEESAGASQEELARLLETENLYRQLRVQFEEKNALLHQTRKELFQSDTKLQTLQLELEHKKLESEHIPADVFSSVEALQIEQARQLEEIKILEDLISHLTQTGAEPFLKKAKKKIEDGQSLLF